MKRGTPGILLAVTIIFGTVVTACGPVEEPPIKIGVEGPMSGEWAYEGGGGEPCPLSAVIHHGARR
jgi:hypothetical protein